MAKSLFEQDRVIVRLQQRVLQQTDIIVCFLSGSFGQRREDPYSDIDVALVFTDAQRRERAWQERQTFVQSVLPYVGVKSFDASHIRPFFHIALYSNGAKVDYRYETKESLTPTIWDKDIHILKDTDKWAEQFQQQAAQAPLVQKQMTVKQLTDLDNRFWVMFWDVYRQLLRGNNNKPFTIYLELLYFTLPPLLQVLPPTETARQPLLQAYFNQDTKMTRKALADLLTAYLAARAVIIRRFHLDFAANDSFETAIQRLVKRTV